MSHAEEIAAVCLKLLRDNNAEEQAHIEALLAACDECDPRGIPQARAVAEVACLAHNLNPREIEHV